MKTVLVLLSNLVKRHNVFLYLGSNDKLFAMLLKLFANLFNSRNFVKVMVTGVVHSPPRYVPSIFIAHRVQHSHCSSIFIEMLLTHALALSAIIFFFNVRKSPYECVDSGRNELAK